jgi:hypothetical protein
MKPGRAEVNSENIDKQKLKSNIKEVNFSTNQISELKK